MSVQTNKIRNRIKSVTGAYKVTSAMKLVSTVKLKKWRNKMLANSAYVDEIFNTLKLLVTYQNDKDASYLTKINEKAKKKLFVVISSTLGLCGAYNTNIFKVADVEIKNQDDAIILGKKALLHYEQGNFTKISGFEEYSSINDKNLILNLCQYIMNEYQKETYSEVIFIHSEYKNSLVFTAKATKLLPLITKEENKDGYPPIFEPSKKELIEKLAPFYLQSVIYAKLLESEVCEQASRSNAMENATNNAKEILDNLNLEFNKARQAAITQEITEIVGAAEAL